MTNETHIGVASVRSVPSHSAPTGSSPPAPSSTPSPSTPKKRIMQAEILAGAVKPEELMHLSRQLASFIRAGVPITDGMRILAEEARTSRMRSTLFDIEERLRQGERLSTALNQHPKVFPAYYRAVMRSAELTGRLDLVLEQLGRYLERDLEARRKIMSALTYPAVIGTMALVTIVVLAGFVLPRFKLFFESLGAELPLPTRMMLALTDFLTQWWWALLLGLAGVIAIVLVTLATKRGRLLRDRILLRLPAIGPAVRTALIERFCRVLGSMVAASVPLPDALRVATASLRNRVFMTAFDRVGEAMLRGEGLAKPLASMKLFPRTAARMIRVGEETGTLHMQLEETARYYESELDHRIKRLTALFEPAMIVGMGLVVGFVAVAMVSAMYGVFNQVDI
jgi:type IV pilus assembly protein PilC